MNIDKVYEALRKAPIDDALRDKAITTVQGAQEELERVIFRQLYKAPEYCPEGAVAQAVIAVLEPVLKEHGIEIPLGQDICNLIYVHLDGKNTPNYQTPGFQAL